MSTESQHNKYRFGITNRTATCRILIGREDLESFGDCVNKRLSCSGCPVAQGYEVNHNLIKTELDKLCVMAKAKKN